MRLFVAVELNDAARREVAAVQAELRRTGAHANWVEPENLHLTLKFLGEVDESRLPALTQALRDAAGYLQPFTISLEGVGAFPSPERPRVFWVGVKEGQEALTALAAHIEEACNPVTLSPSKGDRPFSPHLTIGRVRSGEQLFGLVKKLQEVSFRASAPLAIDRMILFQSVLSPHGPVYTVRAEFKMKVA